MVNEISNAKGTMMVKTTVTYHDGTVETFDTGSGWIRGPGKFEDCRIYVPYYWRIYLDGFADSDDGQVLTFKVTPEDREQFPMLKKRKRIRLFEDSNGFVHEV